MVGTQGEVEFAVLDVETTGFSPAQDRIVEIAIIRLGADGRRLGAYTTLLDPGRDVGPTHVHGISATDVCAAPRFGDVLGDIAAMLQGAIVVGHNVQFDLGFLHAEVARVGQALPPLASLCTLGLAQRFAAELPRRRLQDCCDDAGIELVGAHSALGDATATAALLLAYLARARAAGLHALGDLGCAQPPAPAAAWPAWARSGQAVRRGMGALSGTLNGERITRSIAETLVVADPATQSTKANKARSYGARILGEYQLWCALGVPVR